MALTLVTGLPGHGKTLFTIARWKLEAEKAGRQVFFSGIKGLKLPWQEWETEKWQDLPPGSIMLIDEAQFRLKVHGRGQLPDWIEKLSVHRHGGLDLVLITQNPMMLDPFVRRLIDRHFHVVRKFGMQRAVVHEFPTGVNDNVAKVRAGSIRHEWKYPKEVFEWYQSAELHTVKRRIPMKLWLLVLMPLVAIAAMTFAVMRMRTATTGGQEKPAAVQVQAAPMVSSGFAGGGYQGGQGRNQQLSPQEWAQAQTPRIAGLAHTAPAYDGVTAPQQAPYPAACIASKKRCQCYSQQATKLDVPDELCRSLADGGFFVAWAPDGSRVQAQSQAQPAQPSAAVQQQPAPAMSLNGPPQFVAQAADDVGAGNLPRRVRRAVQ